MKPMPSPQIEGPLDASRLHHGFQVAAQTEFEHGGSHISIMAVHMESSNEVELQETLRSTE